MSNDLKKGHLASRNFYAITKAIVFLGTTIFSLTSLSGQVPSWAELMYSKNAKVAEVSKAYEKYYENHTFIKNRYTQDYKRYLRGNARSAFNTKNLSELRSAQKSYQHQLSQAVGRNNPASWEPLGPFDIDLNSAAVGTTPGLAHVYTIEKDAFLVAGTATAGAWKSSDNGNSWISITSDLMVTEVKAVEVRGNSIFFGGNGNIYRSLDGGNSWQGTGNSTFKNLYHHTTDIISTSSAYFASTNHGLYKSTDLGVSWAVKLTGRFQEIEVHPENPNIIYAIKQEGNGTSFYKSVDAGENFVKIKNGFPTAAAGEEQLRTEIAVTSAISDDQGENWEFRCCGTGPGGPASSSNKNIMAWQTNGEVSGGQYYYDLALAVSQTNGDEIYTGGINIWKSTDGGHTFINNADYIFKKAGKKYVHADIQDIRIYGSEIWVATDGGIFMSKNGGGSFDKKMRGIVGTDFRGFGAGAKDGEVLIGGTYHNGTLLKENSTYDGGWLSTHSGDNTHGNVNPFNNKVTYSDIGIMTLPGNAAVAPTLKTLTIKPNASYKTGESSEYVFHPNSGDIFFLGSGGSLYKTTDNGTNFTQLKNFGSGKVTKIEISPTNPDVIYAVYYPTYDKHKKLFKTTDGGLTWSDVSPSPALFGNSKLWIAWDISVGSSSPDELWLARTPQTSSNANIDGKQIFHTHDGGTTWTNISDASLNGEMVTNIVHQKGTNGGVYLGTRRAVYYKNAEMSSWSLFKSGLPAITYSTALVILYEQGKIVNATHRGVYASELFETASKEVAFQVDKIDGVCERDLFDFSNNSTGFNPGSTVKWTFENGTPAISYESNPQVRFNGVGMHGVSLEILENGISHKKEEVDFITILDECAVESLPGSAMKSFNNNFLIIPALEMETNEISFSTWVKRDGFTKENAGLIMMRRFANSTGLSMSKSGEIKYLWNKTGTGVPTGLFVENDEWTHVAMTVSPSKLKVYVNGIERSFEGNYDVVNFDKEILIGKDWNAFNYYFNGFFDEVSVFDKTLTIEEVRGHMNLVKLEEAIPSLHNYFQFNGEGELVKDLIGSRHASFFSNPDYVESMAPIGRGISQVKTIEDIGIHEFNDVDVSLKIASGISCNSELGVYRIERNVSGSSDIHNSDYLYIVNHFSEGEFSVNGELSIASAFDNFDQVGVVEDSFKLYQLNFDDAPLWDENTRAYSLSFDPESANKIVFEVNEEKQMEGKFLVSYNPVSTSLAISDIYFDLSMLEPGVVDVQWFLHPEDDFIRTELQRSGDGRSFETIKTIDNKEGQLAFQYFDREPLKGRNYYRVKMTYADLSGDYSRIDHIRVSTLQADNFLFPNPISGGGELSFKDIDTEGASLTIYDMVGKKLRYFSNIDRGRVDVSDLSSGSFLVVIDERTSRRQQILIVE